MTIESNVAVMSVSGIIMSKPRIKRVGAHHYVKFTIVCRDTDDNMSFECEYQTDNAAHASTIAKLLDRGVMPVWVHGRLRALKMKQTDGLYRRWRVLEVSIVIPMQIQADEE